MPVEQALTRTVLDGNGKHKLAESEEQYRAPNLHDVAWRGSLGSLRSKLLQKGRNCSRDFSKCGSNFDVI
jgi:hypothetical protein